MASQRLGPFPLSPTKKSKTKRSKRRPEDDVDNSQSSRSKKNKRCKDSQAVGNAEETASHEEPRRSNRTGAGTGGWVAQLEKVANVLEERSGRRPQKVMTMAESLPENPLAPPKKQGRKKAKVSYHSYLLRNRK